ncbi:MAG: methyl-accepting chemotaxis protein, partial [Planctomycetota bacterium]
GQVHDAALRAVLQKRLAIDVPTVEQIGALQKDFDDQVQPAFTRLDQALVAYAEHAKAELARGETSSDELASSTVRFSWAAGVLSLLVLGGAGVWLTRHLSRTVASGAQDLAASSKELQVAAAQQATATTEQSSVITEATTTMKESVITSQQICESTRHVARMAEECQRASSGGSDAVRNGHRALGLLKEQIDQIVRHMLDFGEKSRKIGTILDLVNELADQTNILAVNATIEAAGAGEHGVRFSAVASEIRKLADRVSHATREIRGLVESIRSSVNANVLATEKGQKSADDGLQKFGDVANAFDRINELVVTVTQAAREIELSTRQQATAIEQLSGAFNEAATAARETEASTRQTVQTAEQLAGLSASLLALVKSSRT